MKTISRQWLTKKLLLLRFSFIIKLLIINLIFQLRRVAHNRNEFYEKQTMNKTRQRISPAAERIQTLIVLFAEEMKVILMIIKNKRILQSIVNS